MANLQHIRAQLTSRKDEEEAKGKKCKAALDGLEVVGLSAADSAWARVLSGIKVAEDEVRKLDEQLADLTQLAYDAQQAQEEKQRIQRDLTYRESEVEAAVQDLTSAFEKEQQGLALQKSRAEAKAGETKEQSMSAKRKAEEAAQEAEAAEARYNDAHAELTTVNDKHACAQHEHDAQLQRIGLEHEERSRPIQERLGDLDSLLKQYDIRINTLVAGSAPCIDLTDTDDDDGTSQVSPGPPESNKDNRQTMYSRANHAVHLDDETEARQTSRKEGTEIELTTYKEGQSLNDTFPTIVYIKGEWWELHCSICGTNKRAGENRYLSGLRGFMGHIAEWERGQTVNLNSALEYCKRRKCSAGDVAWYRDIAAGGQHKRSSLPIKLVEGDSMHHRRVAAQLDSSDNESLSAHAVGHVDEEDKVDSEMTVVRRNGPPAVIKESPSTQEENHVSSSLEARQTPTWPRKTIANYGVIHKSFPSVIRFKEHWIEVCCARCGANSENGEFFNDMRGLASHVRECHSNVNIDRVSVKVWSDKRNVDERDVRLMEKGRSPKFTAMRLYTGDEAQGQPPVLRRLSTMPPPTPRLYPVHEDEYSSDGASLAPSLKTAGVVYPDPMPSDRKESTHFKSELPCAFNNYQPVIHRDFPMVTRFRRFDDFWHEICCAICGANMDGGGWFKGTRGVEVHVRTHHPEIKVDAVNPQNWSNARRIAPRDASLMQDGLQPEVLAIEPYTGDAGKGHPPVTRRLDFAPAARDGNSRDFDDTGFSFRGAASGITSKKRPHSPPSYDPRKRRSSPTYERR